jgi:hypothetical protein
MWPFCVLWDRIGFMGAGLFAKGRLRRGVAVNSEIAQPEASCKNCALQLARIVYRRHWWFPLLREPLVLGMRLLAWWHRIDPTRYPVGNPECRGCLRFIKTELEEKSPTFRFLNGIVGEPFSRLRNARLTQEELDEAKRFAKVAMGAIDPSLSAEEPTTAVEPARHK